MRIQGGFLGICRATYSSLVVLLEDLLHCRPTGGIRTADRWTRVGCNAGLLCMSGLPSWTRGP